MPIPEVAIPRPVSRQNSRLVGGDFRTRRASPVVRSMLTVFLGPRSVGWAARGETGVGIGARKSARKSKHGHFCSFSKWPPRKVHRREREGGRRWRRRPVVVDVVKMPGSEVPMTEKGIGFEAAGRPGFKRRRRRRLLKEVLLHITMNKTQTSFFFQSFHFYAPYMHLNRTSSAGQVLDVLLTSLLFGLPSLAAVIHVAFPDTTTDPVRFLSFPDAARTKRFPVRDARDGVT